MPRAKKTTEESLEKIAPVSPSRRKKAASGLQIASLKKLLQTLRVRITTINPRYLIIFGVIVLVIVFAFFKKEWFVAAIVNREAVSTIELYQNLKSRYGEEVLEQIIRDKLISQEARRQNITLSTAEIEAKYKEVEEQLGGTEQFKLALEQSGITESDFRSQIKTQLLVEKILDDKISVTDQEVTDFIAQNPTDMNVIGTGTEAAPLPDQEAIKKQLRSSKLNDEFQTWYTEVESKASVLKFI